ncbi:MAG: hypothetical protein FWH22_03950, partial [Fibromonadales bacterium]|nr:hypothetical protein [Fibromonadales bacterium]
MANFPIKTVLFCALLCATAFSQTFSIEAGANSFLGDLQKEIKTAPYGGIGFELGLSDYTSGYLQGSYSYLNLKSNKDFHGLHQFIGRAGLETPERLFSFASVGLGI